MRVYTRAGAFALIFGGLLLVTSPAWSDEWWPAWSDHGPGHLQPTAPDGSGDQAYDTQAEGGRDQTKDGDQTCERMLSQPPDGGSPGLDLSTSPRKTVMPGQSITLQLPWT